MTLLLLTSDEGYHNCGVPHQISAEESSMVLVNIAYISNINLFVLVMSHMCFRVNPHSIVAWMSRNSLLEAGAKSEVERLKLNSNPQPFSSLTNTQPFSQTGQFG